MNSINVDIMYYEFTIFIAVIYRMMHIYILYYVYGGRGM